MIDRYENKEEDLKAISLINKSKANNLNELEIILSNNIIPFRERYVFYFIGLKHSEKRELKENWNTDKCPFKFWNLKSDWWEKYLQYNRPMKLKFRSEINPELPKLEFSEVENAIQDKNLHSLFIKTGYEYKKEMDNYLNQMVLMDLNDPNADWNSINFKSPFQIWNELKDIDRKYDTYELKILPNQRFIESDWCPACHESPCMCSDPF